MKTYHSESPETIPAVEIRSGEKMAGRSGERGPAWCAPYGRSVALDRPSQADLRRCLPQRGRGAPARTASHKENIRRLLVERGPQGVRGSELYSRPDLYGRSPRNRISELRAEGALIEGKPHGGADWWYQLVRERKDVEPERLEIAERPAPVDPGELPLFAGVEP